MLQAQITDEQREQLLRSVASSIASLTAAFQQLAQACIPILQATAEQFVLHTEALQAAGYLDEDGKPIKAPDRPAWQSPYGPPQGRR